MCPCPWVQRVLLGWAGRGDLGLRLKEQLSLGLDGHQASLLAAGLSPAYLVPAAPAPPSCAPGSVPSGCASSCQDLISLPVMPPLALSFLGQTNPSTGCRSPSKSCLAMNASR